MKGWGWLAFTLLYGVPMTLICGGLGVYLLRKFEKDAEEWAQRVNKDVDGAGHV